MIGSFVFFLLAVVVRSELLIESDGGYVGLVVHIDKAVPEEKCSQILDDIQTLLTKSSKVLNNALDHQAYLKSVTVVVPASWRDANCGRTIRAPKGGTPFRKPHVLVTKALPNGSSASAPLAQQSSARCGAAGDLITIPYQFVLAKQLQAKGLVREFAKFRYGIFDEQGFAQDRLYPGFFYAMNGRLTPTGAAGVSGQWIDSQGRPGCEPETEECYFLPTDAAKCSMGFIQGAERFCGASDSRQGPTKQAVLCAGRSAKDVIFAHKDFARVRANRARAVPDIAPEVTVVRQPQERIVLLLESSASMAPQWRWISKAAQKLIRYDLPVDSNLAVVTFANVSKIEHASARVSGDDVRARLADAIPDRYHLSTSDGRCVLCAVQSAVHRVLAPAGAFNGGAHLVLVTRGTSDTLSITDEQVLANYLRDYSLKLSVIIVPEDDAGVGEHLPFYDAVADSLSVLRSGNPGALDLYTSAMDGFSSALAPSMYLTETPLLIHRRSFKPAVSSSSSGTFEIDASLGRDTLFGLFVEDEDEHDIRAITFKNSKGEEFGPFSRMSSKFDVINFKTINFPNGQAPPFNAPHDSVMSWTYVIDWHSSASSSPVRNNVVVVTSKPRSQDENDLIRMEAWVRDYNDTLPIDLFAKISRGGDPVVGARVRVSVEVDASGDLVRLDPVEMLDNGYGDPDMTSGDGIYSLHLTSLISQGRYRIFLDADDNNGRAFVARSNRHQFPLYQHTCCGSSMTHLSPEQTEKTGDFRRSLRGPEVALKLARGSSRDPFPPGKIGDFELGPLASSQGHLKATWTAPGGDYYAGKVAAYRLVFSPDVSTLLDPTSDPQILMGFDRSESSGTTSTIEVAFPYYEKDFYVAIYAIDAAGNRGPVSNLAHVRLNAPAHAQNANTKNDTVLFDLSGDNSDLDWIFIGAIAGGVGVLLVLSVAAVIYYFAVTAAAAGRKKVTAKAAATGSISSNHHDETDSSSFDSDIKNIMSNPLGPPLAPPSAAAASSADSGVSSRRETPPSSEQQPPNTPVYWSASQLLSKLDHGPYVNSTADFFGGGRGAQVIACGPHSLQHHHSPTLLLQQPPSIHSLQRFGGNRVWSSVDHQATAAIPEEFTITVGEIKSSKIPPPIMPKPRNITQV